MYLKLRSFTSFTPLLALVICSVTPCVYSWGPNGHAVVATIAQIYTRPAALNSVCQLLSPGETSLTLSPCSLASVASWADTNKGQMLWSAPLHYVGAVNDKPPNACAFPGPNGWNGQPGVNVFAGIHNTSQILLDWASHGSNGPSVGLATEALKFIIHFFGDVQMPLHLTGFLRGGNQAAVCLNGEKENLHYVWDNLLPDHAIAQVPGIYTHSLPPGSKDLFSDINMTLMSVALFGKG
ncbi:Nuclease S1 [Leucoagaricus sp. SymC.cos]|nr:Nuclease S1 [Leucoagaricus sp. SymC.cos]